MTMFTFELWLLGSKSEEETKRLLWGKVLADEALEGVQIHAVVRDGMMVLGEYHTSAEEDFVESLREHAKSFHLYRFTDGLEWHFTDGKEQSI